MSVYCAPSQHDCHDRCQLQRPSIHFFLFLEDVLQRKLNLAGGAARLCNLAGLRITSAVAQEWTGIGDEEIRMVRQVEEFRAELKP